MILLMSKQLRNTLVLERVTVDELNRHPSLCCLRVYKASQYHHRPGTETVGIWWRPRSRLRINADGQDDNP